VNKVKKYTFQIDEHQAQWAFSSIRAKRDVINLLMRSIKMMSLQKNVPIGTPAATVVLTVSKMSRLFLISPKKIFSINFPFSVQEEAGVLRFRSSAHRNIDSKATSDVLALLANKELFNSFEVLHFAEPISDACVADEHIWGLFRELLLFEDGYIRYDYDQKQANGKLHPLHHLDVFYSNSSTFKLGLHSAIGSSDLEDLLDIGTDCRFIQ
jgi:hypothetical protein